MIPSSQALVIVTIFAFRLLILIILDDIFQSLDVVLLVSEDTLVSDLLSCSRIVVGSIEKERKCMKQKE